MEAFAALGLASNIVQFVDFTCKLLASTRAIHRFGCDHSPDRIALGKIANDAKAISAKLDQHAASRDPDLELLSSECKNIARDLLEMLGKLKLRKDKTRWASFVLALKDVAKQRQVTSLYERLSKVQTQLNAHIQHTLLDQQGELFTILNDLQQETLKLKMNVATSIESLRHEVRVATDILESHHGATSSRLDHCLETFQKKQVIDIDEAKALSKDLNALALALKKLGNEGEILGREQRMLRRLYFPAIPTRHNNIERAHAKTFTWILEPTNYHATFVDWLARGNGTFWVQGKAGSGKSTLMKFIYGHSETTRLLRGWAGESNLVVLKFFFWYSGTALQKSLEGLLRALLFEFFRECPALIEPVCGDYHQESNIEGWDVDSLIEIFHRLMKHAISTRFCIFIDGLDEYHGAVEKLVDILETISTNSNVKICVSSRPWIEFIDAYGGNTEQLLKLEDLTKDDIRRYAADRFDQNKQFQKQAVKDPRYAELIEQITQRAKGVFLWVFLVVRSLLEGLKYADRVSDLQRRLDMFPEDLESFFQHMIDSIPKVYRSQTARTFKVALAADRPLKLMTYSFMDDLEEDPAWAFKLELQPMEQDEVQLRCDQMRRRLDGRCKGLLEVYAKSGMGDLPDDITLDYYEVEFLHRTVRDFLQESRDINRLFRDELNSGFDANVIMCGAALATLKGFPIQRLKDARCSKAIKKNLWEKIEFLMSCINQTKQEFAGALKEHMYIPFGCDILCEADPVVGSTTYVKLKFSDGSKQVLSWPESVTRRESRNVTEQPE